jgi:hypothetical protein
MLRDKATELAHLPHQYDQADVDICRVYWGTQLHARHWPVSGRGRAATTAALPREHGI